MKKRLIAMTSAVLMIGAMLSTSAMAAGEPAPLWEPACGCGGSAVVRQAGQTGRKNFLGEMKCPVNSRYNCDKYEVEYYTKTVCNKCGDILDTGTGWYIEWEHFNH